MEISPSCRSASSGCGRRSSAASTFAESDRIAENAAEFQKLRKDLDIVAEDFSTHLTSPEDRAAFARYREFDAELSRIRQEAIIKPFLAGKPRRAAHGGIAEGGRRVRAGGCCPCPDRRPEASRGRGALSQLAGRRPCDGHAHGSVHGDRHAPGAVVRILPGRQHHEAPVADRDGARRHRGGRPEPACRGDAHGRDRPAGDIAERKAIGSVRVRRSRRSTTSPPRSVPRPPS